MGTYYRVLRPPTPVPLPPYRKVCRGHRLGVHDASFNIVVVDSVQGFRLCAGCFEIQMKLQQFTNSPMLPPQGEEDW